LRLIHHLLRSACIAALTAQILTAQAQQWRAAPAYDQALAANVIDRSVLFLPLYGAVYRAKFEVMLEELPVIRGVVIHNHGCGGPYDAIGAGRPK
jgi:hypothetical protein